MSQDGFEWPKSGSLKYSFVASLQWAGKTSFIKLKIFAPNFGRWKRTWSSIIWPNIKMKFDFFLSFPQQLKWRDEGIFYWEWHDLKFRRNTFETVKIMIWTTPLMESMFTYVFQKYINQPWFQSYGTRSAIFGRCTIFLITQIRFDSCA